jgi:V/A-type H+-transporting ATPase subunit C
MLDDETWQELDRVRDVPSMLDLLQDTTYGPQIAEFEAECPPCELLEARLNANVALRFARVIDVIPEDERELVVLLKQLYEVDNLKTLLRGIQVGESVERMRSFLFPLGRASSLDIEDLLQAEDVPDLVLRLQGTPYGDALRHALARYESERALFPLEVALDLDYYRRLWEAIGHLTGMARKWADRLIGTWYDIVNVTWALRYKYYYEMSLAEIINYTLPYGYKSSDRIIRGIAEGRDVNDLLYEVWGNAAPTTDVSEEGWLPRLEVALHRYLAGLAREALMGYPFHLGVTLAYLLLKRYEVQDLMVLAEAKMAKLPRSVYHDYMIHQFREW